MNKKIRKAVRTYLVKDNQVVVIKYKVGDQRKNGYYDIPGGKIEEGETSEEAAIREFQEETGIEIINPKYIGNLICEYPEKIFDLDVYIAYEYSGEPIPTEENDSFWIDIDKIVKEEKIFSDIYLLDYKNKHLFSLNKPFKLNFVCDDHHRILDIK